LPRPGPRTSPRYSLMRRPARLGSPGSGGPTLTTHLSSRRGDGEPFGARNAKGRGHTPTAPVSASCLPCGEHRTSGREIGRSGASRAFPTSARPDE
jgi:hypothetical protein